MTLPITAPVAIDMFLQIGYVIGITILWISRNAKAVLTIRKGC
jgi:hypothetical protein